MICFCVRSFDQFPSSPHHSFRFVFPPLSFQINQFYSPPQMSLLPPFLSLFAIFSVPFFPFCASFPSLFGHSSSSSADPPPLMCYRGIKYFVGQEEIDDNIRCELNMLERAMPGMEKYCYKFVSHTGVTDFVKRGCSVVICSGLRNVCAKLEFEGVQGEMCCCSESSYCNASEGPALRPLFVLLAFSLCFFASHKLLFTQ